MKLFLTSLPINEAQVTELVKLAGANLSGFTMGLIENASDPYSEDDRRWRYQNRESLQKFGVNFELIDLHEFSGNPAQLEQVLSTKDVIWAGGGNTFYLRWVLHDTGADTVITKLVKQGKIYGGDSAGAIVAGPTLKHLETADDPGDVPEIIWDGLHLIDWAVVPHMDNAEYGNICAAINKQLQADGFDTIPLNDGQALIVAEANRKVV